MKEVRLIIFATHPIQYQVPMYQELAKKFPLLVVYCLRQNAEGQAAAGFGVAFEWDVPLFDGYEYQFIENTAKNPSSSTFNGITINREEVFNLLQEFKPTHALIQGWFPRALLQIKSVLIAHSKVHILCRGDSTLNMTTNPLKRLLKRVYIPWVLKGFDTFLYVGKANKAFYQFYGIGEEKLWPAHHCINTPLFQKTLDDDRLARETDIFRLGFVGKLIEKKDPLLLIEALAQTTLKEHIIIKIIGDGPLREELQQHAKILGVRIEFLGFMNQRQLASEGYRQLDCLVLPSKENETWGLVVNEAMTQGLPCIVSDRVGCHPDLVEHNRTGWVFPAGNISALASLISEVHHQFGSSAWTRVTKLVREVIDQYSLQTTTKQILSALDTRN